MSVLTVRVQHLDRLTTAYAELMKLPLISTARTRVEPALCILRDTIAEVTGMTPEQVQTTFESIYGRNQ